MVWALLLKPLAFSLFMVCSMSDVVVASSFGDENHVGHDGKKEERENEKKKKDQKTAIKFFF